MDNPELIEEYPTEYEVTQFEKILVAARRAKDLHNDDRAPMVFSDRKAGYVALQEIREKKITMVYWEEEEKPAGMIANDSENGEEEE